MVRKPTVAGQFYPRTKTELESQISLCFSSSLGPADKKTLLKKEKLIGLVCPHAGYYFSGQCQAWSYKALSESMPDTVIFLGLSHMGLPSSLSIQDWETPLGILKNDTEIQKAILMQSTIPENERAHSYEHSIEVQLPFLQYIASKEKKSVKIAPIIASPDLPYQLIASTIFSAVKNKDKIAVVASSDFTHYGPNYDFVPFTKDVKNKLRELDLGAVKFIKGLDPEGFLHYIEKTHATICGYYPIAVLLELSKLLAATKAELLQYYSSGDITGDFSNSVGYASIKIIKK